MIPQRLNELTRAVSRSKRFYSGLSSERLADFPPAFEAKDVERGWYETWEKNKCFAPQFDDTAECFKMILPPPNVTGVLHLGHALTVTVQDVLGRWHKMKGESVMWVPGLDHAGIATQAVLERHLQKTKQLSKNDIGREKFNSLLWNWVNENGSIIRNQLEALGAGFDWRREYFTMGDNHSAAVRKAFITLNEKNLIYRDKRIINWSPAIQSTISEIEVESIPIKQKTALAIPGYKKKVIFGQIFEIAYKLKDSNEELIVATTRPETIPGDVALAVHPDDARYAKYIGQMVWNPFRKAFIPVIADPDVSREFGTGVVKITPAHNATDYAIARRHNLDVIDVIDQHGKMTAVFKELENVPRYIARERILNILAIAKLLRNVKDHSMMLPRCSRSGDVIELFLKEQWFIKCKDMAKRAVEVVKDGSLKINPPTYEQVWYDWLENIRDWCVSRQLWWGHQIPAYAVTVGENTDWIIAASEKEAQLIATEKYGPNVNVSQDTDVLDTWFSSGLLPFVAMGWPNNRQDFSKYYPLTLMETGHDILFFWVARMVMLGLELTNQLPFKEVLLHGVLCDAQGKKMSKSVGNVINPENIIKGISLQDLNAQTKKSFDDGILNESELKRTLTVNAKMFPNGIPECGVDALRMTLSSHNIKERIINFTIDECRTNKHFCNKIWQLSKYVLLMTDREQSTHVLVQNNLDCWILSKLSKMIDTVNEEFEQRNFSKAFSAIKQFIYYEMCDFYVEGTKFGFMSTDKEISASHAQTLVKCLEASLRILAPIAPYLTDELYMRLSSKLPSFQTVPTILLTSYPCSEEFNKFRNIELEQRMEDVKMLILTIRSLVGNISKKLDPQVDIVSNDVNCCNWYNENVNLIKGVTRIWNVSIVQRDNYIVNEDSIYTNHGDDCHIFFTIKDREKLHQIKMKMKEADLQQKQCKMK